MGFVIMRKKAILDIYEVVIVLQERRRLTLTRIDLLDSHAMFFSSRWTHS